MDKKDPKYQAIVDMWNKGSSYQAITAALQTSNQTVKRVVQAEGLKARQPGPHATPLAVESPAHAALIQRQLGVCALCDAPLPVGVVPGYVPSPDTTEAIFACCAGCMEIVKLGVHSWRSDGKIFHRLSDYHKTWKLRDEVPLAYGAWHLERNGEQVLVYSDGRLAIQTGPAEYKVIPKSEVVEYD